MKLSTLIEILEEIQENYPHDDPEVRLATQPTYPLAAGLSGVYFGDHEETPKVWLNEGVLPYDENPYSVPRDAWDDEIQAD